MARSAILPALMVALAGCSPYPEPPDPPLDPTTIERTGHPNDYLVCAAGSCSADIDAEAPVVQAGADDLFRAWLTAIEHLGRVRIVDTDPGAGLIHAEQRSRYLRFVDTILVKVMPLEDGSTFAVYSRSELGYGDFGVNRERVETLLAAVLR